MGKRLAYWILVLALGSTRIVPAGLVGHWRLDDGSGTVAADSSGNGYHGALIGGPTWVAGVDGGALQFDGRDDYVNMSNSTGWPAGGSPRSMTGWGKTDTVAAGYRWIVAYGSAGTNQAMFIGLNGTTLYCGGYGNDVTASNTWVVGEWFHIGLTYDGTTARAYVNGREVGSAAKTWNLILGRAHIGRQVNDAAEFWDGTVDDVRIYDHALTAAEMKALVPLKVKARNPNPASGAVGVLMPLLQWTPGETALFEDVYLGTTPELTAADRVATHQPAALKMYFHLQPLAPGQTYYWRVDAIEPAGTVHMGDVWSFTVTPKTAWAPKPADGARYVGVGVALQWTIGMNATAHDVYFGTDRAAVAAGTGGTFKGNQPTAVYTPTALERGTTYYWRVDEVAGGSKTTGPVWSFTVRPVLPRTDPTLVGWYKLEDENAGTVVVDYSGWDCYGTLIGPPRWVEGYNGEALDFDGDDDYVDLGNPRDWPSARAPRSLCGWAKTDTVAAGWKWIAAYGSPATGQAMFIGLNGADLYGGGYGDDVSKTAFWEVGVWRHICLTYDGTTAKLYADGLEVASAAKTWNLIPLRAHIGRQVNTLAEFWDGMIDDVRVYNVALTSAQIKDVMRGEPSLAWNPQPRHNANADIRDTTALNWSAGEKAAQHDVYFGTDKDAVKAADTGSPLYQGRRNGTSFALAGLVEFGGGPYFWRIDEVEADGTIHEGMVWSFTIPGYLIVDDMEGYTDEEGSRIYETWIDGWTNGTGSQAGYLTAPFAERTIVHGGKQSLPVDFNNARSPFYSEIERTFAPLQDWTVHGVMDLRLWFRGHPVSFVETAPGSITMSASGNDIWNNADQFRFAFKRLTGNGSITVKVESVANTNGWAKAGVMIRESLDPGSRHAAVVVTPSNGVSFPRRVLDNDVSVQINQTGIATPHWVRLTRTGDVFKAEHSADGKTWVNIGPDPAASSATIPMFGTLYIGLCLTSHNTAAVTTAQFSGVAITGGVSGQWQSAGIGADHPGNSRDDLYLAVEDSAGKMIVLTHPDPAAVLTTAWTEWKIPLSSLTQVNLARIKKLYLGVGDRQSPAANGTGRLYLDDICVTKP